MVGLMVNQGHLVIEPLPRPRYTLDELLAQCDPAVASDSEDHAWLESQPVGHELL